MFDKLIKWFKKPFPFYETLSEKIVVPLTIGLFVIFCLFLFNPFYNSEYFSVQVFKMLAYGLITFTVLTFFNIVTPLVFKDFFELENWNIWKTILFELGKLITIGISNGLFAFYFDNPSNNDNFPYFQVLVLYRTLIISIIPIILLIFWLERKFYKKYIRIALTAENKLHNAKSELSNDSSNLEYFESDSQKILLNTIYFIKSDGNYSTFYFDKNGSNCKTLIRTTLKEIEEQIGLKSIVRCHKSYIVNLEKVSRVAGNARGYLFYIDKLNQSIPVSRNFSKSVLERLN